MITLTSFVSKPSLAPIVSTAQGSGSYRLAHRRVNKLGQFSALSPISVDRAFPMVITPQAYQDGDSLLRDEILISDNAGATWYLAHSGLITSPVTISAWSSSWPQVSIGDTQVPGTAIDAGKFNPGSAPSFDIFLLTESSTFSTVSLRLWDTITGSQASMFAGLVQLVYSGQIAEGTGALTSGSGVTIWQGSEASTFPISVAGFANQVHKFQLTFLGYPPSLPALSLGFELSANKIVYSIDLADDWAEGSLWLNPDKQFLWPPLKPTTNGGNVTIERFAIAGSGAVLLNAGQITKTLANGTHWLSISPSGEISLNTTVPAGNYTIAKAIVSGDILTKVFPACTFRAQRLTGPAGPGLVPYRFINFANGVLVPSAGTTGSTIRVSTNSTGSHITSGFALVEAGGAIGVGSNIRANSVGKAINESGIGLGVALSESFADGDLILVQLITAAEGGGAMTSTEIRDALESLTGTNRLDASSIKNLPSLPSGAQIRDSLQALTGTDRLNANALVGITTALEALTGTDRLDAGAIKNLPGGPTGPEIKFALESLPDELKLEASAIRNLPSVPTLISQLTNDTNFTTLTEVASAGYLTSIPNNSISTTKVQDGAITDSKLASGIDASKITTGTIPSARIDTGTGANKIVKLDGSGRLPAIDGSQLINLPSGGGGGAPIAVQYEGTPLTSQVTGFNFTGAGVGVTNSGSLVTINIPGGGGGLSSLATILANSNTTGASNTRYLCDTSSGSFTITLPASPANGDLIEIADFNNTSLLTGFGINPLIINANTNHNIAGNSSLVLDRGGQGVELVFHSNRWTIKSGIGESDITTLSTNTNRFSAFSYYWNFDKEVTGNKASEIDPLVLSGSPFSRFSFNTPSGKTLYGLKMSGSNFVSAANIPNLQLTGDFEIVMGLYCFNPLGSLAGFAGNFEGVSPWDGWMLNHFPGAGFRFSSAHTGDNTGADAATLVSLTANTPYLVHGYYKASNNTLGISVNGSIFSTAPLNGIPRVNNKAFKINSVNGWSTGDWGVVFCGISRRLLTANERAYIFNNGDWNIRGASDIIDVQLIQLANFQAMIVAGN